MLRINYLFFHFILPTSFVLNQFLTVTADHQEEWQRFENWTLSRVDKFVKFIEDDIKIVLEKAKLGEGCQAEMIRYLNGLKKLELESMKSK